jgi:hypothetical protein
MGGGVWRAQVWHGHLARGRAPGNMGKMPMPLENYRFHGVMST